MAITGQQDPMHIPFPREGTNLPGPDPWKHRSTGMKCNTCMWFVEKVRTLPPNTAADPFGRCRRHAPTHNGYPAVFGHDWCGDHKLDENKI